MALGRRPTAKDALAFLRNPHTTRIHSKIIIVNTNFGGAVFWSTTLSGHISSSGQRATMIFGSNRIYSSTRTRSCKDRGLYPFLWRSRWPYNGPLIWDKKVRTNRIVLFRCNLESEGYNDCFEYPNASIIQEAPSVFHMGYI